MSAYQKEEASRIRTLDRVTFFAGLLAPFTTLPQILDIYTTHNAAGVSLASWVLILIIEIPWIMYGLAHNDRPIIVSYVLWTVADVILIVGILLYR